MKYLTYILVLKMDQVYNTCTIHLHNFSKLYICNSHQKHLQMPQLNSLAHLSLNFHNEPGLFSVLRGKWLMPDIHMRYTIHVHVYQ